MSLNLKKQTVDSMGPVGVGVGEIIRVFFEPEYLWYTGKQYLGLTLYVCIVDFVVSVDVKQELARTCHTLHTFY